MRTVIAKLLVRRISCGELWIRCGEAWLRCDESLVK